MTIWHWKFFNIFKPGQSGTCVRFAFLLSFSVAQPLANAQKTIEVDLKSHFAGYGVEGCFVLFNESGNEYLRYNPALCEKGYIPASTFKIPHALIALEEGIITDTAQVIPWDGHEWPNPAWNKDQTLKSSLKNSCVWVYVRFAGEIGIDAYHNYIRDFNYGNQNIAGPPDRFWLVGELKTTPDDQIDFLRKFYRYELAVERQNIDYVKEFIVIDSNAHYRLSGKTGGGIIGENTYIMWLVGYLEREEKVYYYALNFESGDFTGTSSARVEIVKGILRELGLLD